MTSIHVSRSDLLRHLNTNSQSQKNFRERPSVFVKSGMIFSSPNVSSLPTIPSQPGVCFYDSEESLNPQLARTVQWSLNAYPQLAYSQATVQFQGPILAHLAHNLNKMPVVPDKTLWRLNSECATSWKCLEDALVQISNTLLGEVGVPLPLHFNYFPLPSTKGYLQTHSTSEMAMQSAAKSCDMFMPLMAMCSMAISFVNSKDCDATNTSWNLRQSLITQFRLGLRLGVIVDVSSCQWLNFTPAMLDSHVPIWYYWGNVNPDLTHPTLSHANRPSIDQYCPMKYEISSAATAHELTPTSTTQYGLASYSQELPKPEAGSGQCQGESWQQFFARQDIRHAEMAQRESEIDQQRRKRHKDASAARAYSGKKGPTVFMWTDDDGHGFLRTRVPQGEVNNFWEDFTDSQKKFNSFENKWDLCVEFDTKARTQEDIEHELEYFGEAPNSDNFSSQPPLLPLAKNHYVKLDLMARTHEDIEHSGEAPNSDHFSSQPTLLCLPEDHWRNNMVHTFAPNDEPMTTNDVNRDPLDDYMYFRFRFTSPPIEQSSQPSSKEWREICMVVTS